MQAWDIFKFFSANYQDKNPQQAENKADVTAAQAASAENKPVSNTDYLKVNWGWGAEASLMADARSGYIAKLNH